MTTDLISNTALRGAAVAVLLLLSFSLLRGYARSLAARLGAAFAVGVAAFAVSSSPEFVPQLDALHAPIVALSSGNAIVFWLFACALFQERFRLRAWHAAVWMLLVLLGLTQCTPLNTPITGLSRFFGPSLTISTSLFAAMALGQAILSWREDLVEGRRRLRAWLVAVIGGYTVAMSSAAIIAGYGALAVLASTANAFGLALLSLLIAWRILHARADELFVIAQRELPHPELPASEPNTEVDTPPDPLLVATLIALMEQQRVYREHTLTIGSLAEKMNLAEHKLRRLINQGMGFRNFSSFLNSYRLAEVKAALSDPARIHLPVLTIALDTGFQSIGPFNRAFKADTGMTPTEFRRQRSAA